MNEWILVQIYCKMVLCQVKNLQNLVQELISPTSPILSSHAPFDCIPVFDWSRSSDWLLQQKGLIA